MTKKIVIAVMVIDDEEPNAKPEYYENIAIKASEASNVNALRQTQQWVSEQVVRAKLKAN